MVRAQNIDGEEEEKKKTREIIEGINNRRAERIQKYLPRWFLIYRRFRSTIFIVVILLFDSLLVAYYFSSDGVISISIVFALISAYIAVSVADRVISYLAFHKIPIEVYYQEESHY